MNNAILAGAVASLCGVLAGNAVAGGDINVQVENHLTVPLRYRQSECVQARCPRSFPTAISRGSLSTEVVARSIRGNGGSIRLDYDSAMGTCRFIVQTVRQRDGRCEKPTVRAFPVNNRGLKCSFIKRSEDTNCNLTVEFIMSQGN